MDASIAFAVNGESREVATDPSRSLLAVLREDLDLTGTQYGCGESQCGACTVWLNGAAIRSCVTPVSAANGRRVQTIEGLAEGESLVFGPPVQGCPGVGYSSAASPGSSRGRGRGDTDHRSGPRHRQCGV